MSPLNIHCLLEYHTMPWGSPDIKNRHSMAVASLLEMGLIVVDTDADDDNPPHKITPMGTYYVEQLQALPLPVMRWEIPEVAES